MKDKKHKAISILSIGSILIALWYNNFNCLFIDQNPYVNNSLLSRCLIVGYGASKSAILYFSEIIISLITIRYIIGKQIPNRLIPTLIYLLLSFSYLNQLVYNGERIYRGCTVTYFSFIVFLIMCYANCIIGLSNEFNNKRKKT